MRLTADQTAAIREAAAETFGGEVRVWLFGSRVDDAARGGDIDLYLETPCDAAEGVQRELTFYARLQRRLGERRIDVVARHRDAPARPIHDEARSRGVRLL